MKKDTLGTIFLIFVFLVGLSLLLYPTVSDYWNTMHQSRVVLEYAEQVSVLDNDHYDELLQAARDHNAALPDRENPYLLSDEALEQYYQLLNVSGNGIIGYIDIPAIGCTLPIYHGTSDAVLSVAVGHLEWTSLPVGGESTHCVVSGHRALPSARLFTDLDKLAVGDIFLLQILDETLTYEVDQIRIVEPHETEDLLILEGEDLCTLVTCTPYGINSHRLLVRGHRIENVAQVRNIRVTADAMLVESHLVAIAVAIPMVLAWLIYLLLTTRKSVRRKRK